MFLKRFAVVVFLLCACAAFSGEAALPDADAKKLVESGKPFAMVVGENTIVVDKYRIVAVPQGEPEKSAVAGTEQEDGEELVKVESISDIVSDFWEKTKNLFYSYRKEFSLFGLGLVFTFILTFVLNSLIGRLIARCFGEERRKVSGSTEAILRGVYWPLTFAFIAIGIRLSFESFKVVSSFGQFLMNTAIAFALCSVAYAFFRVIDALGHRRGVAEPDRKMDDLLAILWRKTAKLVVGVVTVLFIFQNVYDLNINTLLASAGVVGLAVAFAAQNTLANFFGSMMIIIDRPFTVGDRVMVAGTDGVVESVGFRSTRIRALDGSVFIMPNSKIADAVVQNITRRPNIKYAFDVGLVYSTSGKQMTQAIAILHEILDGNPFFDMKNLPPRIYFTELRDSSLNISVTVWFNSPDWFAVQQQKNEINLAILDRFNAAGLSMAYPSQSIYLDRDTINAIKQINPAQQVASK